MSKKLICHDCQRVIPAEHFEKEDKEIKKELDIKLSEKGNGFCNRCISDAMNFEPGDILQDY